MKNRNEEDDSVIDVDEEDDYDRDENETTNEK